MLCLCANLDHVIWARQHGQVLHIRQSARTRVEMPFPERHMQYCIMAPLPAREHHPYQNNSRCCVNDFWNHGIWQFLFVVVHEDQGLGLGMVFYRTTVRALNSPPIALTRLLFGRALRRQVVNVLVVK